MMVVGARPQFIKSAPLIKEIVTKWKQICITIVHSGQHYDPEMSAIFFRDLGVPEPSLNLRAGSGSHATQTATIMKRLESSVAKAKPDMVIVPGDTNTTLAAALTAAKLGIPVAHVEAGLRSGEMTMPEEINRKLTDHCSMLLFAPTPNAAGNLKKEGLGKLAYLTGDTMVEALKTAMPAVDRKQSEVLSRFDLLQHEYVLATLHRSSNVDDLSRLGEIVHSLSRVAEKMRVVFPVHPRTRARLADLGLLGSLKKNRVTVTAPQGYVENLCLLSNAGCLLTDSGGMQKEAFMLHVPCITLRPVTEWPETLTRKANQLLTRPEMIPNMVSATAGDEELRNDIRHLRNPFGDGHASARIAGVIQRWVRNHRL